MIIKLTTFLLFQAVRQIYWQQRQYDTEIISYSLFADDDKGIHPHAALQYHMQPKAKATCG